MSAVLVLSILLIASCVSASETNCETGKNIKGTNDAINTQNINEANAIKENNALTKDNSIYKQTSTSTKEDEEITIKKNTTITINSPDTVAYNDNITVNGKFTDEDNKELFNSVLTADINGKTIKVKTDNTGTYTITTKATTIGTNNITISHQGNDYYNPTNTTTTYKTTKQDLKITINPIKTTAFNENVTITGMFTDKNNNPLYNSMLAADINGKTIKVKTDNTGKYTITTKATTIGTNNITISHQGNDYYNPTNTTTTYKTTKQDLKITINPIKTTDNNEKMVVTGILTDKNNNHIINTCINITVNNKSGTTKTDTKGLINYETKADILEKNDLKISFSGNDYYNKYTFTKSVENPDIRLSDSEIHPGVEKTFLVLVPYEAEGNGVFKINQKTISDKIDVEFGMVMYTYTIPDTFQDETYALEFTYSGDNTYLGKSVNSTLTLTPEGGKVNPTMKMNNITATYNMSTQIVVKLDDDAFGVMIFKASNTNISSEKFMNGTAKCDYTVQLLPGKYNLTATYNGNYKYYPKTINSTLTVNKLKSTISMKNISSKAGQNTLFTATVTNQLNEKVKNMNVTFKMNGKSIGSNITNEDGIVRLYYTLPSSLYNKTYNITATASESVTTIGSSTQATLTLTQLKTKVTVPNISTKPSKTIVITATVIDEFKNYVSKGVVTFKKDGVTLGKANVTNGFAKFTYTTNYETSNKTYLYAYYVGDWKYASSNGTGTYQVTQLKTITTPSAIDAKPNSDIVLKAIIRDQNQNYVTDGSVRFSLNNTVVGTAKVRSGVATLSYTLKSYPAKNYRIKAEYLGSKVYKPSSNTNTMTITRYDTTLRGSEIYAVVGSKTAISISVIDEEKYNVNNGKVKYYINEEYIGSADVSNGVATLEFRVPSKYDGKTVKYYANYVKNGVYDSSSYTSTMTVTHQKTVYVSPSGSDSNLGDKKHPFKTIQYAVTHISLFGTVKLEAGTYSVSGLQLNTSVNFVGSGRDKTFIDGGKSGKPVFNITKRNAVLSIKGITIKNAKSNSPFSAGAIVTSGKLNIENSRFINNTGSGAFSGGAIYTNGILNVTNTEFINNIVTNANSQGGAIRCYDNTTYITKCKFESNQVTGSNSTGASAIYGDSCDIIINKTTFNKNIAKGKYITGGVIRSINGAVVIADSKFTSNQITSTDYAMGGIIGSLSSGISILNSTITSNTIKATNSAGGSAIYVEVAAIDIKDSKINSNTVSAKNTYGGAIYSYKAYMTLINNEINTNKLSDTTNGYGGAIYAYEGQLNITKTKFTSNTIKAKSLALAGAIYSYSTINIVSSTFEKNNINASNLGGGAIANMGNLVVTKSNFINNSAYNAGDAITATTNAKNSIENNYWGSSNPNWKNLLYSVSQPKTYSKTKL